MLTKIRKKSKTKHKYEGEMGYELVRCNRAGLGIG